jgi:hypothetical protein
MSFKIRVKFLLIIIFALCINFFPATKNHAYGQKNEGILLHGIVYDALARKPVQSGMVLIIDLKNKVLLDNAGSYRIFVPKPGLYTIAVKTDGYKIYKAAVVIDKETIKNIPLEPLSARDSGITITGKRDLQTVSRHTLTLKQIKEVPATFGDSINAITALPGVIRTGGDLFGPIVIRGGDHHGVKYLIDDIPIYSPLHYGGLHSVINSNLMDEIDLYSSAFPTEYGSATSSIISISTIDDVKQFGGYTDLSLLSASALAQTCIIKNDGGSGISLGSPSGYQKKDQNNAGYIIASGRVSYLDLIVLPLISRLFREVISVMPNYWDYQFKAKYFFNSAHSLTLFCLGSKDYIRLSYNNYKYDGSDPLLIGLKAKTDQMTHGQGIYYTYQPSEKFRNRLTFYSSLRENSVAVTFPAPGVALALHDIKLASRPYIFGFLDKFKIVALKKYLELRGGMEYTIYYFTAKGQRPQMTGRDLTNDITSNAYTPIVIDENILNHGLGGYFETKFTYEGLTILPGFRSDYLRRSNTATWDPRGLISYEFPTNTIISLAGGKYSYFFQINPNNFDASPQYAKIGKEAPPEWAIHRVAGLEQKINLFKIKAEGYWNDFYNLAQQYVHIGPDGHLRQTMSTGRIRAYGGEIMLQKDRREGEDGVFGWVSYAYTRSRFRSGLPNYPGIYGIMFDSSGHYTTDLNKVFLNNVGDLWGKQWRNYSFEQNHSFKLILGYGYNKHTFTGKFMLYTSNPYTPIVFSEEDTEYHKTNPTRRFVPVYGRPNSRHFPINHRLDFRYSNTTTYSWGYLTWYIEVINLYNNRPIVMEKWDYRFPYLGSKNPKRSSVSNTIAFLPNFGVEVKF